MCRISGIWYKEAPDFRPLISMVERQHKGGPDKSSFTIDGNIGFGFNRLAIVDLEGGDQPKENDRWLMVFNGEIYNYGTFRGDTEYLFHLLNGKGFDQTLQEIEGMFSIAAYDKVQRKLHLAVDPFGIKPLYFFADVQRFAFASSPGALTVLKDKWSLDRDALMDYLALGATYSPLFSGIQRLNAGQMMEVNEGLIGTITTYYQPRRDDKVTEQDVLIEATKSIKKTAIADVPVTMFLSGGIDSTLVASQLKGVNAVHLASPEEKYARLVAARYGIPLMVVEPTDYNAAECLEDYARQSGDCSGAAIIPYMVSKEVSKFSKCAIISNGADELFFGYNRIGERVTGDQISHIFRSSLLRFEYGGEDSREFELRHFVQYDLNKTLDFASMCHGLEVRVPYLNKSVVEAALSLPRKAHVNGMGNKSILKRFLSGEGFDESFLQRPKLGFSLFSEPIGYEELKRQGIEFLRFDFGVDPQFNPESRDGRYFARAAAAFYCWYEVWKHKLS